MSTSKEVFKEDLTEEVDIDKNSMESAEAPVTDKVDAKNLENGTAAIIFFMNLSY